MRSNKTGSGVCGVYEIVYTITGSRYIGSTSNTYQRWGNHKRELRRGINHCRALQEAWKEGDESDFSFRVVEECAKEALRDREQYWLDLYRKTYKVFNLAPNTRSIRGYKIPEKLKEKLARERPEILRVRASNIAEVNRRPDIRVKRSERMKIVASSKEFKDAATARIQKVNNDPVLKEKLRERLRIMNRSLDHRNKVREAAERKRGAKHG